jgi:hypothetical protein
MTAFSPAISFTERKTGDGFSIDFRLEQIALRTAGATTIHLLNDGVDARVNVDCDWVGEKRGLRNLVAGAALGVAGDLLTKQGAGVVGSITLEIAVRDGHRLDLVVFERTADLLHDPEPLWRYQTRAHAAVLMQAFCGGTQAWARTLESTLAEHEIDLLDPRRPVRLNAESPFERQIAAGRQADSGPGDVVDLLHALEKEDTWFVCAALAGAIVRFGVRDDADLRSTYRRALVGSIVPCPSCGSGRFWFDWEYSPARWVCRGCEPPAASADAMLEIDLAGFPSDRDSEPQSLSVRLGQRRTDADVEALALSAKPLVEGVALEPGELLLYQDSYGGSTHIVTSRRVIEHTPATTDHAKRLIEEALADVEAIHAPRQRWLDRDLGHYFIVTPAVVHGFSTYGKDPEPLLRVLAHISKVAQKPIQRERAESLGGGATFTLGCAGVLLLGAVVLAGIVYLFVGRFLEPLAWLAGVAIVAWLIGLIRFAAEGAGYPGMNDDIARRKGKVQASAHLS